MSETQFRVLVGPYRTCKRYALSRGWADGSYHIAVRGHQLAGLDPARITSVTTIKLHTMGKRVADEIQDEISKLRALWPVPMAAAA